MVGRYTFSASVLDTWCGEAYPNHFVQLAGWKMAIGDFFM